MSHLTVKGHPCGRRDGHNGPHRTIAGMQRIHDHAKQVFREKYADPVFREQKRQRERKETLRRLGIADDPWLLPEDGVVDRTAIDIAVHGYRPVRLTHTERRLAARQIGASMESGKRLSAIFTRLSLPTMGAARYYARLSGSVA